jgi:DNA processing protein
MTDFVHCTPLDGRYPARLRSLPDPPASISLRGAPLDAEYAVAIVGSRKADPAAYRFAYEVAGELARAGVAVVSGGAVGIDKAAHTGALDCGGRTWAVAPTGHRHCFPPEHAELFDRIGAGPGAMLWPFPPGIRHRSAFLVRNRILVALVDAVIVVQAGPISGAIHAAHCARRLNRPLWVVPAAPWAKEFAGSCQLLSEGAAPLVSAESFLESLGIPSGGTPAEAESTALPLSAPGAGSIAAEQRIVQRAFSPSEFALLGAISSVPLHLDTLAARAELGAQATRAALLTLALEDVVVEGPPGFFRRRNARKH